MAMLTDGVNGIANQICSNVLMATGIITMLLDEGLKNAVGRAGGAVK